MCEMQYEYYYETEKTFAGAMFIKKDTLKYSYKNEHRINICYLSKTFLLKFVTNVK